MPKAKKATDPSAPKKSTRTKKPVASAAEAVEVPEIETREVTAEMNVSVEEHVRQRAYEIYQQRGGTGGTAEQDWLQAEFEILGKRTA